MMEKAVTISVKSIEELQQRTLVFIERDRRKEEERLETGIVYGGNAELLPSKEGDEDV